MLIFSTRSWLFFMDGQDPGRSIAWAGLVIVGILMLAGSAYFSSVKSALVSANKTHLRSLSDGGNRRARIALDQAENCERVMFTVLPGLYLMQVGFVTVLAQLLFRALGDSMARRATAVAVGAVCGALLLFVVSDVLLASVAASHADGFAVALAPTLKAVTILLFPLSALLRGVQAAFRRMFHLREEPTVTEDELSTIIDTIEEEGVIDAEQGSLLQSALEFAERGRDAP
jgi:Mg2+/Co2+ transporter CorB